MSNLPIFLFDWNRRREDGREESDESDDDLAEIIFADVRSRLRGVQIPPPRLTGYVENIVPTYEPATFKSHFRMTPRTAEMLENRICPLIVRQASVGRQTISPRVQLLCIIWLLGTPDSFRSVAEQFGMSKSSLHACFVRVINALTQIAATEIAWPNAQKKVQIKEQFARIAGLPDVVGAIDGCHINIDAPKEDPAAYRTGKKHYAMQLQAVCTADLIYIDCFTGYPGSVNDTRVLRNSPLCRDASTLFEGHDYIIGDKAYYPVKQWCIPPYKNFGNLTQAEINFNTKLSKTRQVIERSFALLKGRFRRLKHLSMTRTDLIAYAIMACCVLHNLCLKGLHEEQGDLENYIAQGIVTTAERDTTESDNNQQGDPVALQKRDYLRDYVNNLH